MAGIRSYVKLVGGLVALALFLVACNQAAAPGSETLDAQAVGDRYIVVLNEAASVDFPGRGRSIAADVARGYGLQALHTYGAAIVGFAAQIPAGRLAQLRADPRVEYVEQDQVATTFQQDVPTGIERIYATTNANLTIDGADDLRIDVDVAVIDTGIDLDHADLNVVQSFDCSGGSPFKGSCGTGGDDDNGHGTHVAGTIAAIDNGVGVVGVAPGARLWAVKVLRADGSGYLSWIIAGIDKVTEHATDIEVANMSLGCECSSDAMDAAITNSVAAGVTYAVAAGNSAKDAKTFSPANHPDVITVSALADFDGLSGGLASPTCRADEDDTLANFSNFGAEVEMIAPGVCILSTWNDGGYYEISGTSMASPHVAGGAALLASEKNADGSSKYSPSDIRTKLTAAGNDGWTEDVDTSKEPLLDVSDSNVFAPATVAGGGSTGGNSEPTANFSTSCTDLTCSFTDASTDSDGTIASWNWDFGDGSTSTAQNPSRTYESGGTYTVTLTVTDDGDATDSVSKSVSVSDGTASLTVDNISMTIQRKGPNYEAVAVVSSADEGATITGTFEIWLSGNRTDSLSLSGTVSGGSVTFVSNKIKDSDATFRLVLDGVGTGPDMCEISASDPDGHTCTAS